MRCGFVSLVGRPNVGKSTLLNSLLGVKLAITSNVSGTTRNIIEGIYNDKDSQIIFVDTPGIHKPLHKLGNIMNKKVYQTVDSVDVILFLVDATEKFGKGDQFILNKIKDQEVPVFLLLNKVDLIKNKEVLLQKIDSLQKLYDFEEIIPLSALKKDSVDILISCIQKRLPEMDKIYNEEELTNVSLKFIMAEFVREQVLLLTREEIPHAVTCYVESFKEKKNAAYIQVLIVVERDSMKKILIGKGGSMLKEIGMRSRVEMEKFLGKKFYLEK